MSWSASFREDELRAADSLGTYLAPKFFYLLTVYGIGGGTLLGCALAAVPVYAFYRGFGAAWRRWAVPFLERKGW